ncbi:DUF349 domain-containing protein [Actinomyces radicidentis]|uniref:DUF349 domain-containing protein n=1 Tax=Actinomyces radicidentis TaxID=111015 RepID=UPI000AF6F4AA|nr:DUF349 domain-containing protein [Actinomyces radicidentis]
MSEQTQPDAELTPTSTSDDRQQGHSGSDPAPSSAERAATEHERTEQANPATEAADPSGKAEGDAAEQSPVPATDETPVAPENGGEVEERLAAEGRETAAANAAAAAGEDAPAPAVSDTLEEPAPAQADSAQEAAASHAEQSSTEALAAAGQAAAAHGEGTQDPTEGEASDAPSEPVAAAPAEDAPSEAPADGAPVPTPAAVPAPAAPAEPEVDPEEALDAAKWGRVDGEGRVFVQDDGAEREVGQFPDAPIAEAMAFYVRRFLDLKSSVDLFATRLPQLSVREIDSTIKTLEESLVEPAAVGDLEGLRARFTALKGVAAERREAVTAERAAAKEQALKDRTAIVERAEAIAAQDPARTQWKNSGAELRELLEQWKGAQRRGPRLDRPTEDGLWKRFSHARTTFDRHRRQFFSELDAKQSQVKAAKEALIKRAEELQDSTDWGGTSAKYRGLMDEWKKAGRTSRKEDDALWARFRAAQQVFFDARRAKDEATDAEFAENLKVKETLVEKAEALLPIKDVKAAKKAIRPIQDAWEEAGRVPRNAVRRIEGRMRAVEDAIREAENAEWRRTDPETKARAEGLAGQLEDSIAELEKDLEAARSAGDDKRIAEAEAALTARRAWLDQVRRSARA